jgi:hypothetical protein
MSISTSGGEQRRPNVVSTGGRKPGAGAKGSAGAGAAGAGAKGSAGAGAAGKGSAAKGSAAKAGGGRPGGGRPGPGAAGGPGGPRRPIAPVKVTQQRPWGSIFLFLAVGVLFLGIIGYGAWAVFQGSKSWQERADGISGIVDYRKTNPALLDRNHEWGPLTYKVNPPVGGTHNYNWQNCMGEVYDAPIASEHAVHSLEHGAVWITYDPSLPADQVEKLASRVRGKDFIMMSPYKGLDSKISLQAWGYQLKVDDAGDGRIDDFIKALRKNATMEPGSSCSGGITATGTTPRDLGKDTGKDPMQGQ